MQQVWLSALVAEVSDGLAIFEILWSLLPLPLAWSPPRSIQEPVLLEGKVDHQPHGQDRPEQEDQQ